MKLKEKDGRVLKSRENTIMVVDDNEAFLEELSEALALNGYNTVAISDPTEVIDVAFRLKPKLILLDIRMPGKTGMDIAREISQLPKFADVPAIAMSGFFDDEEALLDSFHNIKKLIKKPFSLENILKTIQETLTGALA